MDRIKEYIKRRKESLEKRDEEFSKERQIEYKRRLSSQMTEEVCLLEPGTPLFDTDSDVNFSMDLNNGRYYEDYKLHEVPREFFNKNVKNNGFGVVCCICEIMCFKRDMSKISMDNRDYVKKLTRFTEPIEELEYCRLCKSSLDEKEIPHYSTYNGFKYPELPSDLPKINYIIERLISPCIPFVQMRKLMGTRERPIIDESKINIPIFSDKIIEYLPRSIYDEKCYYVNFKEMIIHKDIPIYQSVNINTIRKWLNYLIETPLYKQYNLKINKKFMDSIKEPLYRDELMDDSEGIGLDENFRNQQQTVIWNQENNWRKLQKKMANSNKNLFTEYIEELSFPSIYGGEIRKLKNTTELNPYEMASNEIRRCDRRGVIPEHLFYMFIKLNSLKYRSIMDILGNNFKKQIQIGEKIKNIEDCIHSHCKEYSTFLKTIPSSIWESIDKDKDLFAMLQQLGRPTVSMTLNLDELRHMDLMEALRDLANNDEDLLELNLMQKRALINKEPVVCAMFFSKLLTVLMYVLQSKKISPFGDYRVKHYFRKMEFSNKEPTQAHYLLWLDNAPKDLIEDETILIDMIKNLASAHPDDATGNIECQAHSHTFRCYDKTLSSNTCRFRWQYFPSNSPCILKPMASNDNSIRQQQYNSIWKKLENNKSWNSMSEFFVEHSMNLERYNEILRAGIRRPTIFLKRHPLKNFADPFNPFILNVIQSKMEFEFILDDSTFMIHLSKFIDKQNMNGKSELRKNIAKLMEDQPALNIMSLISKLGIDLRATGELNIREVAWCLCGDSIIKTSEFIETINTCMPEKRNKIQQVQVLINSLSSLVTNGELKDWYEEYQYRPRTLDNVTLAEFIAKYDVYDKVKWNLRDNMRIIRFNNYTSDDPDNYRREMVTLHWPFRHEKTDILDYSKYNDIYIRNEGIILQRKDAFVNNFPDNSNILQDYRKLCNLDKIDVFDYIHVEDDKSDVVPMETDQSEQNVDKSSLTVCVKSIESKVFKRTTTKTTIVDICHTDNIDLWATKITINKEIVVIVVVELLENQEVSKIIEVLHEKLLSYTREGAGILNTNGHTLGLILSINFTYDDNQEQSKALEFILGDLFQLSVCSKQSDDKSRTVFSRYLNQDTVATYAHAFSLSRPQISFSQTVSIMPDISRAQTSRKRSNKALSSLQIINIP